MSFINKNSIGLTVAWLNVLICALVPAAAFLKQYLMSRNLEQALRENEDITEEEIREITYMPVAYTFLLEVADGMLVLLLPGILLVIGITKNYPKIVALWVYFTLTVVIVLVPIYLFQFNIMLAFEMPLEALYILIAVWVYLVLCLIPITMLHRKMLNAKTVVESIPKVIEESKELTAETKLYMPIFEDC